MAWLLALLLALNALFWGYEHFLNAPNQHNNPDAAANLPQLKLLQGDALSVANHDAPVAATGSVFLCYLVGPLQSDQISAFQSHLQQQGMVSRVRPEDVSSTMYMVYIPPFQFIGDADNMAARLRAIDMDPVVIADGPYARAVSLGQFHDEDNADKLVSLLVKQGFPAEKRILQGVPNATWIYVSPAAPSNRDIVGIWLKHKHGLHHEPTPCS